MKLREKAAVKRKARRDFNRSMTAELERDTAQTILKTPLYFGKATVDWAKKIIQRKR